MLGVCFFSTGKKEKGKEKKHKNKTGKKVKEKKEEKEEKDEKSEHVQFEETPQILSSDLPVQVIIIQLNTCISELLFNLILEFKLFIFINKKCFFFFLK